MSDKNDRVAAVRVLARLHRMLEATESGLTLPQYRVLAAVAQGGVRSAHLAERLAVRRPTLTAIADGLVAAGYVCRQSEEGDRRVVRLYATDAGRSILADADAAYAARFGRLLDEISNPNAFVAALVGVGEALDARLTAEMRETKAEKAEMRETRPEKTEKEEATL